MPSFAYWVTLAVTEILGVLSILLLIGWLVGFQQGFDWNSTKEPQFNIHMLLMPLAMLFLYGNAMLVYRTFPRVKKMTLKLIHSALLTVAVFLIIIGVYVAFNNHKLNNYPDLQSIHAWLGLLTVIFFMAQWVGGLTAFLNPGTPLRYRQAVLPWHVFFGCVLFGMSLASCLTGLMEYACFYFQCNKSKDSEGGLVVLISLVFVCYCTMVTYLVSHSQFKRPPDPQPSLSSMTTGHKFDSSPQPPHASMGYADPYSPQSHMTDIA
ncbi:unnamed protein product [Cyprideis torosa]|uniref:Uncharacterized protein n=1 Tax=Cyprideis torosa TaxID=163714 RepID=A0A7R8W8Y2_9CRUS|nr:unnamed protein product [Cyprideis torosa]CAG0884813.1 unnamed protein product [Cyprideis torosa]